MTDNLTPVARALAMTANRSTGTRSTERRLRALLVSAGVRGWRVDAKDTFGRPDFVFDRPKVAVFVDGCYWHGCRMCRSIPVTNRAFWSVKIARNRRRDRLVNLRLARAGWRVLRIWEHELKGDPRGCVTRILRLIHNSTRSS